MWNSTSGNSNFDGAFLLLELFAIALGIAIHIFGRQLAPLLTPLMIAGLLVTLVTPAYWYWAYPVASGIEGAGRILIGGALVLVSLGLYAWAAWRYW